MIKSSATIPIAPEIVDLVQTQNQPLEAQHQQSPEICNEASNTQRESDGHEDKHTTIRSAKILDEPVNIEDLPSEVHRQPLNDLDFISEREQSLDSQLLHCVCTEETTGAHSCRTCNRPIHTICAAPEKDIAEGYGSKVVCPLCVKNTLAVGNRISSKENLREQVQKMLKTSGKKNSSCANRYYC